MMEELKRLESNHPLKCLRTTSHCKEYLATWIVKQMKENGKELLTIEELDVLESYHSLKRLETCLQYKEVLKSHQQAINCGDNGRFHNL